MTPRERQDSGANSVAIAELPDMSSLAESPAIGASRQAVWEELFSGFGSLEHRELVNRAHQQGLLYVLPFPKTNKSASIQSQSHSSLAQLVRELLCKNLSGLCCAPAGELAQHFDEELTPLQRDAVAKALGTPDLFLIQGAKESSAKVLAEIITQNAEQGGKALFLSRTPQGLDHVLEKCSKRESIFAFRCITHEESIPQLAPAVRGMIFAERSRILRERAVECARQANVEIAGQLQRIRANDAIWREVDEWIQSRRRAEQELLQARTAELTAAEVKCRQDLADVRQQLAPLNSLLRAKESGRWWSPAYWTARIQKKKIEQCTDLQGRERALQTTIADLQSQLASLCDHAQPTSMPGKQAATSNGKAHAAGGIGAHESLQDSNDQGRRLLKWLRDDEFCPAALSLPEFDRSYQSRQEFSAQAIEKSRFLASWLQYLDEFGDEFASRLPRLANVVASTVDGLPNDEHFGDGKVEQPFDLVVVNEAHKFSEAELLYAANCGARLVLAGDAGPKNRRPDKSGRRPRVESTNQMSCFHRLFGLVHCDPSRSHYGWKREDDKLFCQLGYVAPEDERYLESETVADQPDIELRIINQPHREPVLAQVIFPVATNLLAAKEFIFRELGEVALQTRARNLCWHDEDERLILSLSNNPNIEPTDLILEEGIIECCIDSAADASEKSRGHFRTICLHFERSHGWDLEKARAWLSEHLGWQDFGRSIVLPA